MAGAFATQAAFDLLVRSSQGSNLKLVDVARWLTTEARMAAGGPADPGFRRSAPKR